MLWKSVFIAVLLGLQNVNGAGDEAPPSCDSCPDQTNIVCNSEGFAFPNRCFALCIGVSANEITNCSSTLLQEVEEAFKAANAHCLNATCGASCSIRNNCGWDSTINQCVAGEVTTEAELAKGNCTELNDNDECNAYTCGANCSTISHCGWDSKRMICATGHVTSNAEVFMGACDLPVTEDFDMCAEFRPCLNGGNCTTTGDYRFTCACLPGFNGMVCENDDNGAAGAAKGKAAVTAKPSTSKKEDEDPFAGMFVGDPITSANAMVLSIIVLLVSVLASATVLYYRRRKLRRDAVNLDSYVEGYVGQMPRRKMNLGRGASVASLDMEYDDNRAVLGIGVDDKPETAALRMVDSPVPAPRRSSVASPGIQPRGISLISEHEMRKCAQCNEEAPIANGSIDEQDMKWYCNVCWRVLDEQKSAEC